MSSGVSERGIVLIISAASGTGKSSLARALVESNRHAELSISHTTREIRRGEADGRDYFYIPKEQFEQMIVNDEFVEYAQVFGNYYGTSRKQIENRLEEGINVVLDIDWQGAQQVAGKFRSAIRVFLLPPSIEALEERLQERGRDSEETILARLAEAVEDMKHCVDFDHHVLNDDFDAALADLQSLLPGNARKLREIRDDLLTQLGVQ